MAKSSKSNKSPKAAAKNVVSLAPDGSKIKVAETNIQSQRLQEVIALVYRDPNLSDDDNMARVARAVELYEDLKPGDGLESMLAMQMVGTHTAAMECLRRSMYPGQTLEGREMNLKHAEKLMSLYAKQVASLNKHRAKGQQTVTVEHVNVAPGGKAIVGNVALEASAKSAADEREPLTIENNPSIPMNADVQEMEEVPKSKSPKKTLGK